MKCMDIIIEAEKEHDKGKDKRDEILSPLVVLDILKSNTQLQFKVIKKYLLNRLEVQDKVIRKNKEAVDHNTSKVREMRKEIHELKTTAKNFNPKTCEMCKEALKLPTIHFMCGHTFHDSCVESDAGRRFCNTCFGQYKETLDKKEQFDIDAKDPKQFYRDLNRSAKKFHVVAEYFGRGLFSDLNIEK